MAFLSASQQYVAMYISLGTMSSISAIARATRGGEAQVLARYTIYG